MTLKRRSFRPSDYDSRNSTDSQGARRVHFSDFKDQIVNKGGSELLKIDVAKLDTMLADLRNNASVPIRDLSKPEHKDLQDEFKQMVSYVSILYDSNSYQPLYNLVKKHFGDLPTVNPGTIGAYFAGCYLDNSFSNTDPSTASCSVVCAGSMPKPKDEDNWSFCKQLVVWAVYDNSKFNLTVLNSATDKENALLFVNYSSYETFIGLSEAEKTQLARMGVKQVQIYGYQENSNEYAAFNNGAFMPLRDVKSRVQTIPTNTGTNSTNSMTWGIAAFIFIVIILLILFFAWRASGGRSY